MGIVIQGPWKKRDELPVETGSSGTDECLDYPWYALEAPKEVKPADYQKTVAHLKRLAKLLHGSGGVLKLPDGWRWNFQPLIDQLNRIGEDAPVTEEIPDEPA